MLKAIIEVLESFKDFKVVKKVEESNVIVVFPGNSKKLDQVSEFEKKVIVEIGKDISTPFNMRDFLRLISSKYKAIKNIEVIKYKDLEIFTKNTKIKVNKKVIKLTDKELEIILYLYFNRGKDISKEELFQNVWDYNKCVESHTLESHIYTLRKKIGSNIIETTKERNYKIY